LLPGSRGSTYVPPDDARIRQDLRRKGVTPPLLLAGPPCRRDRPPTQVYKRYHTWAKGLNRSMRQIHMGLREIVCLTNTFAALSSARIAIVAAIAT
jgi:hypothetical protein